MRALFSLVRGRKFALAGMLWLLMFMPTGNVEKLFSVSFVDDDSVGLSKLGEKLMNVS